MTSSNQPSLTEVDWSALPKPQDDGAAAHLDGMKVPSIELSCTNASPVNLSQLKGLTVLFAYPMTGRPDQDLPDNWDMIPGARGCTPQACAFRDDEARLHEAGVDHIFGLSTQSTEYQKEAASRLHLPYGLLSDDQGKLRDALQLPTMKVEENLLFRRLTLAIRNGAIEKIWFPVFPPDQNTSQVLRWLKS